MSPILGAKDCGNTDYGVVCVRNADHAGMHRDVSGNDWPTRGVPITTVIREPARSEIAESIALIEQGLAKLRQILGLS